MYDHRNHDNRNRAKKNLKRLMPLAEARAAGLGGAVDAPQGHVSPLGDLLPPSAIFNRTCGIHLFPAEDGRFHADFELRNMPVGLPFVFGTAAKAPLPSLEMAKEWAVSQLAVFIALARSGDGEPDAQPNAAQFEVDDLTVSIPREMIEAAMRHGYLPEDRAGLVIDNVRRAMGGRLTPDGYQRLGRAELQLLNQAMISMLLAGTPRHPRRWPQAS